MDNSIIVEIVENFAMCVYALPVIILGMWLSTKSWLFYPIAMAGFGWMAFVISGLVSSLWINPDIGMFIKVMAWTIPPIFFIVLNVGSIFSIQAMKGRLVPEEVDVSFRRQQKVD